MFKELMMLNTRSYNSIYPQKANVDSTMLGQGGGGGSNFYQGPDHQPKDEDLPEEDETDREETAVFPPFDPNTIQTVSVDDLIID